VSNAVTVIGDSLLDIDLVGRVERICPDAPAPVIDDTEEHARPGGAGLAAALLATDGIDTVLITAIANDAAGERLLSLLESAGVRVVNLGFSSKSVETVEKIRIRASGQSIARLDRGSAQATVGNWTHEAQTALDSANSVLVSDYGRGITSNATLRGALTRTKTPMVWDPHPNGATPVAGTTLITPNRSEAMSLAGVNDNGSLSAVSAAASVLVSQFDIAATCITMGRAGALVQRSGDSSPTVIPALSFEAPDACGAGDKFAGSVAAAMGNGDDIVGSVRSGVLAASAFVGAGGAAGWTQTQAVSQPAPTSTAIDEVLSRTRAKGGTIVATGGCFDLLHAGHVEMLRSARQLGDCLVVCLNSDESVRRLKGATRPVVKQQDRAAVLRELACVDAVVTFDEDTPVELLGRIRPDIFAKGGDYEGRDIPEVAALRQWGGTFVSLAFSEGKSTTELIREVVKREVAR
jgi:D-beta-D-heptose 7-phosphate kinase / D-beta-D-heptose 1-phosphate adenosyltransferase